MPPPIEPDRLYTIAQADDLAAGGHRQVTAWIESGALPTTREGLRWRVRGADLEWCIRSAEPMARFPAGDAWWDGRGEATG